MPAFDFRDMLGGAGARLNDPLEDSAVIMTGEALFNALLVTAPRYGGPPVGDVLGYMVQRACMLPWGKSDPMAARIITTVREHLDRIENEVVGR